MPVTLHFRSLLGERNTKMVIALFIAALLEALFGFGVFAGSKSAIHEILAMLCFGFSGLTFGLASILNQLQRAADAQRKPAGTPVLATA
jgi:hypothetical protein